MRPVVTTASRVAFCAKSPASRRRIERPVPNQHDRAGELKEGKTEVSTDEPSTRASKQPLAAASTLTHMHPAWRSAAMRRRPRAGLRKRQQRGMELPVLRPGTDVR